MNPVDSGEYSNGSSEIPVSLPVLALAASSFARIKSSGEEREGGICRYDDLPRAADKYGSLIKGGSCYQRDVAERYCNR